MSLKFHSRHAKTALAITLAVTIAIELHLAISVVVTINEALPVMVDLANAANSTLTRHGLVP